jgi:nitroimidazol reductase NimA-like FMN-containing flavoprotein (pyridoxamine 5'-phosphate oxidase superfamily)
MVCRLALCDETQPYVVPLNFGYAESNGALTLWFHCAKEGRKLDIIRANPEAAFECDVPSELIGGTEACGFTMKYVSVLGNEHVVVCTEDEEKRAGLAALMAHYAPGRAFSIPQAALNGVCVLRLDVKTVSGKRHR